MRRARLFAVAAALALSAAGPARAADEEARARTLYDAAVLAYAAGRYEVAVEAFTEAYKLAPKATLLFSLAQAERRQFTVSRDRRLLKDASAHFQQYLKEVPEGGRRSDAVDALQELDLLAARLDAAAAEPSSSPQPAESAPPAASAPAAASTRLMVSVAVKSAVIMIDGVTHSEIPAVVQVTPGKHAVHVSAPGYIDEEREVTAVEGSLVPIEVPLRERPSFLMLGAPAGVLLSIDGQLLGAPPLGGIELSPGAHRIAVTKTGHRPFVKSLQIERGQTTTIEVALTRTTQRWLSYGAMGATLVAAAGGVALTLGTLHEEGIANKILGSAKRANILQPKLDEYNEALQWRNDLRIASGVAFGATGALAAAAAALYLFDNAAPPADEGRQARQLKVSLGAGPGLAGIGVSGAF